MTEARFGYSQQEALFCRGRATTQRAKPQDSAAGGPAAHIKALGRQSAPRKRSPRRKKTSSRRCGSETQKSPQKPKPTMGSTMSTTAPGHARTAEPKQSPRSSRGRRRHRSRSRGRRRQSPLGLFIRGRRGSDDESEDDLSVSSAMSWEATAPPSPRSRRRRSSELLYLRIEDPRSTWN